MFDDKNAVVVVVLFLVVLQPGVESQSTIDSFEDESYSQSNEECRILIAENDRLKLELEREQLLVKILQRQPVVVKLIQRLGCNSVTFGMATMLDKTYVLCYQPNLIKVFENQNEFRFLTEIALNVTKWPCDIVYSKESKCFYIGDVTEDCIWKMTTTTELTKWLTNVTFPRTFSLSNDGQVLKLKKDEPFSQLIIYGWNANVVRTLQLPEDVKEPRHAVQTTTGNFILSHRLNDASNGTWVISKVNDAGQQLLIHRFIPRNKAEELDHPVHLSLDSENSRLFVADTMNHRVILLDSNSLIWNQILLSNETNGIFYPNRVFYDVSKRRLMVAHHSANEDQGKVDIYELNYKEIH